MPLLEETEELCGLAPTGSWVVNLAAIEKASYCLYFHAFKTYTFHKKKLSKSDLIK